MLPLFDDPPAPKVARPVSTAAERDAFWSGFGCGYHGLAGVPPRAQGESREWHEGKRIGALFKLEPRGGNR